MPRLSARTLAVSLLATSGSALLASCQLLKLPSAQAPTGLLAETMLVPDNSVLILSMTTDSKKVAESAPASLQTQIQEWQRQMWAEVKAEEMDQYLAAVDSWAGEQITLAVVDPNLQPGDEEGIPGFLIAVTTQDAQASSQFLAEIRQAASQEGAEFSEQQKDGVKLHLQTNGQLGEALITGEFGKNYVAIANDPQVMERAVQAFRGQSLGESPQFQSIVKDVFQEGTLAFAYLNTPALLSDPDLMAEFTDGMDTEVDVDSLKSLEAFGGIAAAARWNEAGLLIKTQVDLQADSLFQPINGSPMASGKVIQRLPGNALAVFSATHPGPSWQARTELLKKQDPTASTALDELRDLFKSSTQMDLDKDVLSWMDGEVALAVLPDQNASPLLQGMGAVLVVETSQKEQANATLDKLDALARQSRLKVTQQGDQTLWGDPFFGQPLVTRSWSDNYLVLASSGAAVQAFIQGEGSLLPQTQPLQTLYDSLSQPNYGYFLLNWQGVIEMVETTLPGSLTLDAETRTALKSLEAMGMTSYAVDQNSLGFDLLITVPNP
ncbi:MAG: DUF3352 domain-containing protein [Cyanobacteriota bacterium]|nr:DUF3352 domain-containing protein [Cyanobacteriota bacterium]